MCLQEQLTAVRAEQAALVEAKRAAEQVKTAAEAQASQRWADAVQVKAQAQADISYIVACHTQDFQRLHHHIFSLEV